MKERVDPCATSQDLMQLERGRTQKILEVKPLEICFVEIKVVRKILFLDLILGGKS